jgi:alpha-1,3-rhamnosyl/mannosyltransferase
MPRRVLVNDRCLYRGGGGVSVYLRNVLSHWPVDSDIRVEGFCGRLPVGLRRACGLSARAPGRMRLRPLRELGRPARLARRAPHALRRLLQRGYARLYARAMRRGDFAASFEPNHLATPVDGPVVTTVHDLSVLEHPEWHPPDRVAQWEADLDATLSATTRWIAVSRFTRQRMTELLSISSERIAVTPLAARPLPDPGRTASAAGLPDRYLLHVGVLEPRKNVELLLDAWMLLPAELRRRVRLVLAGGPGWGGGAYFQRLMDHPAAGEVLTAGHVGDRDTALLLRHADGLLAPSPYEGFGLPLVEAMAAGLPVVCSTAEAFGEVAGEAARRLDPDDPAAWAEAMVRAVRDDTWRAQLTRAGRQRAQRFGWDVTAQRTAAVIASVLA